MAKIDCFTVYSHKEQCYVEFLKKTADHFASGNNDLNWMCVQSCEETTEVPEGFECVGKVPNWQNRGHASMNHSLGIHEGLKHVKSDYGILMDADIAILYPGWDEVVLKYLDDGYDCFGWNFGPKGPRYRNFPGVFFFAFNRTVLDKVQLDFSPILQKGSDSPMKETITDPVKAKYLGCKVGDVVKHDTAAMVPITMKNAGMKGFAIPRVLGSDKAHLLPFGDKTTKKFCLTKKEHMCEWHYNGKLFGTHKQAGRSHHLHDSKWGRTWHRRINLYTESNFGVKF